MADSPLQAQALARYLPDRSDPAQGVYAFAYTITITNTGAAPAQLIARHWVVRDARGHIQEVRGLGVVGQQPLIRPGQRFEYTSGCELRTASGGMQGHYLCVTEEGEPFDCPVPAFVLEAGAEDGGFFPGAGARVLH